MEFESSLRATKKKAALATLFVIGMLGVGIAQGVTFGTCESDTLATAGVSGANVTVTGTPVGGGIVNGLNDSCTGSGAAAVEGGDGLGASASVTASVAAAGQLSTSGSSFILAGAGTVAESAQTSIDATLIPVDSNEASAQVWQGLTLAPGETVLWTYQLQLSFSVGPPGPQSQQFWARLWSGSYSGPGATTILDTFTPAMLPAAGAAASTYTYTGYLSNIGSSPATYSLQTGAQVQAQGAGLNVGSSLPYQYSMTLMPVAAPPVPVITAFSPQSGAPGTVITISGTGLQNLNVARIGTAQDGVIKNNTPTSVQVVVPADAVTGQIALGNGATWAFSGAPFTVTSSTPPATPVITAFSPVSGPAGTVITVSGTGLQNLTAAWVGNARDGKLQNDTASSVQIVVPSDASTGQLALGNGSGWAFSSGTFTVTSATPGPIVISKFSPTSGAPGTVITINGTGLQNLTAAWVGNARDGKLQNDTATSVQVVVPADASTGQLALGAPPSWGFSSGTFTVTSAAPLAITGFSPGSVAAGGIVTVTGTGLAGLQHAWIGTGHDVTIQNDTATSVQLVVPADATSGQIALGNGSSWVFSGGSITIQ